MARIKSAEIIEALNVPLRQALDEALVKTLPSVEVDKAMVFRELRRALLAKLKTWEQVPNSAVDAE